ncbi:MAG: glycosyltransferase [bacterium]
MHKDIINHVIFAPGTLAIDLVTKLQRLGHEIVFFTPKYELKISSKRGQNNGRIINVNSDFSFFEQELKDREYGYIELLNKHPLTFITLARQVQSELIAKAIEYANDDKVDILHFFTNEEELALTFSRFSTKPTVFTHHEPFNFLTKYRSEFSKYPNLNWISISKSQQKTAPKEMNFVGNVYNGIDKDVYKPNLSKNQKYFAYFGRIIEAKGVHLAIKACIKANVELKIAGKHYESLGKDTYWDNVIKPYLDNENIKYVGFLNTIESKQEFLSNAKALIMPSVWEEPFGMVAIESLASGTPVIGLNSGAIPEIIDNKQNGYLVKKYIKTSDKNNSLDEDKIVNEITKSIKNIGSIDREKCRISFEESFTLDKMALSYLKIYSKLTKRKYDK